MRIGSIIENQSSERRVSITPEIAKKFINIRLFIKVRIMLII